MSSLLETLVLKMPHPIRELGANVKSWQLDRIRRGGNFSILQQEYDVSVYAHQSWQVSQTQQLTKLNTLLDEITQHVPYYRSRQHDYQPVSSLDDLSQLPTLSKAQARQAGNNFFHSVYIEEKHYTGNTSGSTGSPFVFKWTIDALRIRYAIRDSFYKYHGINPQQDYNIRMGGRLFMSVERTEPPFWIDDRMTKQLMFSLYHMSDDVLAAFIPVLLKYEPRYVTGYPSAVYTLAKYCQDHAIPYQPRAVITDSETVLDYQRVTIREAWACDIHDYYGMEAGWIMGQCHQGHYHLSPKANIVEILDDDGQPAEPDMIGEVVVTDLTNPLMPLIRYRTGDMASWSEKICDSGWQTPVINAVEGRLDDIVTLPNGRKIGRLDHIFKTARNIRECQIIQETPSEFTFLVVPEPAYSEADQESMLYEAYTRLGKDVNITVDIVDEIPKTSRNKFRSVISKV